MSTSSSKEGFESAGHFATSSGLASATESNLCYLSSDTSEVQTDITPPTSPTPSEGKMRTPRDILDASRRLGQMCSRAFQGDTDVTPTRPPKEVHYRAPSQVVANDEEAGYDADGDGDVEGEGYRCRNGNGNGDVHKEGDRTRPGGACVGTDATAPMRPVCRRPAFLRIDTRQHRRVASMLAIRGPRNPAFVSGAGDGDAAIPHRPRAKPSSMHLLKPTTSGGGKNADAPESYELRRRPRAELVGLGIGFPENHPFRSRAFTMPVPTSATPISDSEQQEEEGNGKGKEERMQKWGQTWHSEWRPLALPTRSTTKPAQVDVHAPNPVRLVLRPTFLAGAPSPIEDLPAGWGGGGIAGTFRRDDARDRLEIERERSRASARKGRVELDRA